jgi:hypothetical protein
MTERYMLPVAIGIAAAAGLLAARSGERVALGLVVFLLAALVLRDAKMWVDYGRRGPLVPQPESMALVRDVLDHEPDPNIPMVISSGVTFLPTSYYGTPLYGHRIVALTDYAAALRYVRSDSVDRALQRLRLYLPIEVQPFEGFAPKHPRFYVFSNYESFDWWPRRLLEDGYSMRVIRLTEKQAVYLVEQRVGK